MLTGSARKIEQLRGGVMRCDDLMSPSPPQPRLPETLVAVTSMVPSEAWVFALYLLTASARWHSPRG